MPVAIKVENLSKAYQLGELSTGTVSRDIERWFARIRGKEDPFLKIGEVNDRTVKGTSDVVWSLKDINFEIKQGDAVGIIGRNGAGKSTLLKILSRVTTPTTGLIKAKGRIASLLEVGTGFHPELTGKENIYLNGAILGMRKKEIDRKLDQIVDFSGVERYLDTPVKRYSSGMYVRLAFAVAAHLDSEILIVDEVLAVGDAEFQAKCLGKMKDVSSYQGRTVLFVSHSMPSVQKLCNHGILLKNGTLSFESNMNAVIDRYLESNSKESTVLVKEKPSLEACLLTAEVRDENNIPASEIPIGGKWKIVLKYKVNQPVKGFVSGIGIVSGYDVALKTSWQKPIDIEPGEYEAVFEENEVSFSVGQYKICIGLSQHRREIQYFENLLAFDIIPVVDELNESVISYDGSTGIILNPMNTATKKII
jgi:ABC-type polysaccharide/polyol phosphate transport system ATPase subunit